MGGAADRCRSQCRGRRAREVRRTPAGPSRRATAMTAFSSVERAIEDIAAGRPVVVVDDADRENEGDVIFAAEMATPELLAFTIKHTSGVVCVPLAGADFDRLDLPPMYHVNQDRKGTAYTVSVDAREGVTTGISAADRAHTIRLLSDPTTTADDLARPGHVFPLRAAEGGVLRRTGHTEAGVDLARLPGPRPAAPATPRRASTSPGSPVCAPPPPSPRSRALTAAWRGSPSWSNSPASTG